MHRVVRARRCARFLKLLPRRWKASQRAENEIRARRWFCVLCCEQYGAGHVRWELECCARPRPMCASCLRRCCANKWECPFDGARIPMLVVCGVSTSSAEYVTAVQLERTRTEKRPPCPATECHGLLQPRDRLFVECDVCRSRRCARAGCGEAYEHGHRCTSETDLASRLQPAVRRCPGCGLFCDKTVGCNIVFHAACRTQWCYLCGEDVQRGGCTHSRCQHNA